MTNEVEELYLRVWQEIRGTCVDIAVVEAGTVIILQTNNNRHRLRLPSIQSNSTDLQKQRIAVIKTDRVKSPYLIRKIKTRALKPPNYSHIHTNGSGDFIL